MSEDGRRSARDLIRPHLEELPGYLPVEHVEVLARELGVDPSEISKLDGNENPYGASPKVAEALGSFGRYHIYPDPAQRAVREAVGRYAGVDPEHLALDAVDAL